MKETDKVYVEDRPFTLPCLEDGPMAIGDLWNCHDSTCVNGFNLFGKKLSEDNVQIDNVQADDYMLTHVKSTRDRQKSLDVKGEVSLELMNGLIKVGGGAEYDKDDLTSVAEEELLCTYDLTTCSVRTLPSVKETVDRVVLENIIKGITKATHVVIATKFGAKVTASINVKETNFKSKENIKGNFFGKLILGPVTAAAKISLGMLDTEAKHDFDKTIKINSRPAINSQPTTIEEMFSIVSSIHNVVEKHVAFQAPEKAYYGVPIKFSLVPITQFIEVPIERLYLQMKDTLLENLTEYLTFLKDFQVFKYLHKRVLEAEPRLKKILYDTNNPLTLEISENENDLREKAKTAYTTLGDLLKRYKVGKADEIEFLTSIHSMEQQISLIKILELTNEFVKKGAFELNQIVDDDIEDSHKVELFTNEIELQRWYGPTKPIKILLRTGGNGLCKYALAPLYGLSEKLSKIGIKVGVALPNISNNQNSLALKINGREEMYTDKDVKHVVEVLKLVVNEAAPIQTRFYTIYAILNGIKLPFGENLDDLHSLISILKKTQEIEIGESYLKSRDLCFKTDDKYKFMINLEALDSATDSVSKLNYLQHLFGEAGDWIVGKFDFKEVQEIHDSPILFAFRNEQLTAICCDTLDALMLHKYVSSRNGDRNSTEALLQLLQPNVENMQRNCFRKNRAQFAVNLSSKLKPKMAVIRSQREIKELLGFSMASNELAANLQNRLDLIRNCIVKHYSGIHKAVIKILSQESEKVDAFFKSRANIENMESDTELSSALQNFLESENPFYGLATTTVESIEAVGVNEEKKQVFEKMVENLLKHNYCPAELAEQIGYLEDILPFSERVTKTLQRLENYLASNSDKKLESIAVFIRLLNASSEKEKEKILSAEILPSVLSKVQITEVQYPGAKDYLSKCINSKDFYGALHVLSSLQTHSCLYRTQQAFATLKNVDDKSGLAKIVEKLAHENNSVEQYETVFRNQKFQLLLEKAQDFPTLLEQVKISFCTQGIPHFLPNFLRDKLETMMETTQEIDDTQLFQNFDDTVNRFRRIAGGCALPDNFSKILLESLMCNNKLKEIFSKSRALLYWDETNKEFVQAWDCQTVETAYEKLLAWKIMQEKVDEVPDEDLHMPSIRNKRKASQEDGDYVHKFAEGSVGKQLMGDSLVQILPAEYLKLQNIMPKPDPTDQFENGYLAKLMPFILQRLKMWGLQTISPDNLSSLIKDFNSKPENEVIVSGKPKKINFGGKPQPPTSGNPVTNTKPISKLDLLSSLLACLHPLIFQDIMKLNCQFSMALPLVLRNIRETKEAKYTCVASLLETCNVKWEYIPGKVRYNEMLTSPFKMITCVRVGSPALKKPGKSSILNQVLSQRNMFSSFSNPGSQHGKPLTLDGSVEFCALTQETATPMLWQSAVQQHYATGTEQVLLLANMHGDCLQFPETLKLLKSFASKFIIFLNTMERNEMEEKYTEIESIFDGEWNDNVSYILVDPTPECEELMPDQVVQTAKLVSDCTAQIIRNIFSEAIKGSDFGVGKQETVSSAKRNTYSTIRFAPEIATPESQDLIDFIQNLGCQNTKAALELQKMDPKTDSYQRNVGLIWNENIVLREVVSRFYSILQLPLKDRLIAMSHLDKHLSLMTAIASTKIRDTIMDLRAEKIRSMSLIISTESENLQHLVKVKLDSAFEELDKISLGLEHLYREAGRVYAYSQTLRNRSSASSYAILPANASELLVHGDAIEVLDGEISDMCSTWFNSICHSICKKYGENLRIFVVSIMGLQSSGKSTLLNALFACKFAVSVGRCTRGLFMRILFLEDALVNELGVDAIIVLDTEGLGAPEKLTDENCEQKDRLLATFTMSVSNLTLINVLGESIRDLSDILQIVIVTLARLEKANISPDICMVQHLSERDSSKTMRGETEFANALQEAVSLTEKKDMNMGIRNSKSLQLLEQRIKKGDLAKLFPPFKNGATINAPPSEKYQEAVTELYQMILDAIKASKTTQTFHSWHEIIHSYWDAVSKQDYALRFKNIREIQDFIERGSTIAAVKSAVDDAFRKHREDFQKDLRAKFNTFLTSQRRNSEWENVKKELLKKTDDEMRKLPNGCPGPCDKCADVREQRQKLYKSVEGKPYEQETQDSISKHIQTSRYNVAKNLNQMADALLVTHGKCTEIDEIVSQTIQDKLKVKSNYSEGEMGRIIDEIWQKVRQIVSTKLKVQPAIRRILNEISEAYTANPNIEYGVQTMRLPDLSKESAVKGRVYGKNCLDFQKVNNLLNQLDNVTTNTLAKYSDKHFEAGMVRDVQLRIEEILARFERAIVKKDLLPEFKWKARVYGLIQFTSVMVKNEEEWNQQHNPMSILIKREDEYRKKIKIFLEHGFGYESEGQLIGEKLLTAIRQLAQKKGDEEHVKFVKGHSWLLSSENVRLRYFVELAGEVESGQKLRAVDHFRSPKFMITNWFKSQVDQLPRDRAIAEYQVTADSEFEQTRLDIRQIQSAEGLRDFTKNYLTSVDGVEYNPQANLDFKNATDSELNLFKNAALKKLEDDKGSVKQNISITKPSENEKILKILGCNEHCYWCGALCWGEFEHDKNVDDTKKHHACHQANGLIGTHHKEHDYLLPHTCDGLHDELWKVYWPSCEQGMKWGQAKRHQDFSGWIFTAHSQNLFSDLMKWFFVNLHVDIAAQIALKPAPQHELQQKGFLNIANLRHIISEIECRLGTN